MSESKSDVDSVSCGGKESREKKNYLIKEGRKDHQAIKYFYTLDTRRRVHLPMA